MGARYVTWLDGAEATVEIVSREGRRVTVRVEPAAPKDGADVPAPREVVFERHVGQDGAFHLVQPGGMALLGRVIEQPRGWREVVLDGGGGRRRARVRAASERDAWLDEGGSAHDEREVIVSMPGLVVKVLAEVGATVEQGEPVLIIEAMKMENEVKAGRSGVVTAVHVSPGDLVEGGTVLMEIGADAGAEAIDTGREDG